MDTINDFVSGPGGDVLHLADLLQGESAATLDDYLTVTSDGTNTVIAVDADGVGVEGVTQTIVLTGVDLTVGGAVSSHEIIDNLLSDGNLSIDI